MQSVVSLMLIRAMVLSAFAQEPNLPPAASSVPGPAVASRSHGSFRGAGRGYTGFQRRLEHALGLSPEQREAVHGLLAQQHEELQTLRETMQPKYAEIQEQTDAKIRALLNPEQQKKFDALVAQQKQSRHVRSRRASPSES